MLISEKGEKNFCPRQQGTKNTKRLWKVSQSPDPCPLFGRWEKPATLRQKNSFCSPGLAPKSNKQLFFVPYGFHSCHSTTHTTLSSANIFTPVGIKSQRFFIYSLIFFLLVGPQGYLKYSGFQMSLRLLYQCKSWTWTLDYLVQVWKY